MKKQTAPLALLILLFILTAGLSECSGSNPTRPRDVPTARFSAQANAADGAVTNATTPATLSTGPLPASVAFSNLSTFPEPREPIASRWRVSPPGEEFRTQDFNYIFRQLGEFLVTLEVEVKGEFDRASMVVLVSATSSTAAAVREVLARDDLELLQQNLDLLHLEDGEDLLRALYGSDSVY